MIRPKHVLYMALASLAADPGPALGQAPGDLAVTPTRVVLEGRNRTAKVTLLNKGSESATYRISIVNLRMTDAGRFVRIEEASPDSKPAGRLLRYAPRQVVLQPGASQTIRILLRKPKDLAAGEYRSHIYFAAVPKASTGRNIEAGGQGRGIQVRLTVVPGVTIPVIVRHGNLTASATLSELALRPSKGGKSDRHHVVMRINRQGDRSLFGDLTVTFRSASGSQEYVLAQANKLAVYTPNEFRNLILPLRLPKGVRLDRGQLHVAYRARPKAGGKIMAEGSLNIP